MIEYYTFKHRGDSLEYLDEVYLTLVPSITVAMFYGPQKLGTPVRLAALRGKYAVVLLAVVKPDQQTVVGNLLQHAFIEDALPHIGCVLILVEVHHIPLTEV